jgi:hypothetical protein
MNASAHSEVLTDAHPLENHSANASADHAAPAVFFDEQPPLRGLEGFNAPHEGTYETFIDGGGI